MTRRALMNASVFAKLDDDDGLSMNTTPFPSVSRFRSVTFVP
jgi:hypothetical protein